MWRPIRVTGQSARVLGLLRLSTRRVDFPADTSPAKDGAGVNQISEAVSPLGSAGSEALSPDARLMMAFQKQMFEVGRRRAAGMPPPTRGRRCGQRWS